MAVKGRKEGGSLGLHREGRARGRERGEGVGAWWCSGVSVIS